MLAQENHTNEWSHASVKTMIFYLGVIKMVFSQFLTASTATSLPRPTTADGPIQQRLYLANSAPAGQQSLSYHILWTLTNPTHWKEKRNPNLVIEKRPPLKGETNQKEKVGLYAGVNHQQRLLRC